MGELKVKIRDALLAHGGIQKPRVLSCKPVGGRYLVYLTSPSFRKMRILTRQKMIADALEGSGSPLTPQEQKQVGFVRTFTPAMVKAARERLKAKRLKKPLSE